MPRPGVMDPIDLHGDTPLLPGDVEVVAPIASAADHLSRRFGQTAAAAFPPEVQLAQRAETTRQGEYALVQQPATTVALDPKGGDAQLLGCGQVLLDAHGQQQGRLTV